MTTAERWDDGETLVQYRDDAAVASGVVWNVLSHDRWDGGDFVRVWEAGFSLPEDCYAEDFHSWLYSLVSDAAEYGYRLASVDLDGFDRQQRTTADVARALAAMVGRPPLVEGGHSFPTVEQIATELDERNAAA